MTDQERRLRRKDRWRLGLILALFMLGAVPVVVAFAASPDPTTTDAASTQPSAPALTSPGTDLTPSTKSKGNGTSNKGDRFGGQRGSGFGAVTITAIDGSSLSLKTDDGWTRSITVGPDTKITKAGTTLALSDLAVGDHIRFAQKKNDDGTYTVTAISVPTALTGGEVTAINGSSLTLKRRNGDTQVVTLTGSTTYRVGRAAGDKGDVTVGSKVTVAGDESGTTFTALTVDVLPTLVAGEVTAKTADTITIKRRDGSSLTIHVSADTKYGVRGTKDAGLSDLAVGDTVWAAGISRTDGSLDAGTVAKGFGRGKGDHQKNAPKPGASSSPSTDHG